MSEITRSSADRSRIPDDAIASDVAVPSRWTEPALGSPRAAVRSLGTWARALPRSCSGLVAVVALGAEAGALVARFSSRLCLLVAVATDWAVLAFSRAALVGKLALRAVPASACLSALGQVEPCVAVGASGEACDLVVSGSYTMYVRHDACFSSVSSLLSSLVANGRTNSIANLSRSAVRAGRRRRGTNGRARLSQTALCALVVGLGLLPCVVAVRSGGAALTRTCRGVKRLALLTRLADRRPFDVCDRTVWARLALGAEVRRVWQGAGVLSVASSSCIAGVNHIVHSIRV